MTFVSTVCIIDVMEANSGCKHDFKAVLFCPKCQAEYDIAMVEIIRQAKIDAINKFVKLIKSHDESKKFSNVIDYAIRDFEEYLHSNETEIMFMGRNKV